MSHSRRLAFFFAIGVALVTGAANSQETARPTQSVVDYLKAKGQPFGFQDRKQMYLDRFGADAAYSGTAEQNLLLLRTLIAEENNTAPQLCRAIYDERLGKPEPIIVLIGGFGWGSRSTSGPPDLWQFETQTEVEPGLFTLIAQQVPANWDEAEEIADEVKARVEADLQRPVVLVGHSFGATGVIKTAEALLERGVSVDLAVAIDAINSSDPAGMFSNTLSPPGSVAALVHIAAGSEHWALDVADFTTKTAEYRILGTEHVDVDQVRETHDILRYLVSILPAKGINHAGLFMSPVDYTAIKPPATLDAFPEAMRSHWEREVTGVPAQSP